MNDAALGGFIERGHQFPDFYRVRLSASSGFLLQPSKPGPHAAVMLSALKRLPGTFRC